MGFRGKVLFFELGVTTLLLILQSSCWSIRIYRFAPTVSEEVPMEICEQAPTRNFAFDISPDTLSLGLTGVYFTVTNLRNSEANGEFDQIKSETFATVLQGLSLEAIEKDPVLQGFRQLHDKVGCSGKKNVASPENLLAMLLSKSRLPSINLLVDIYNLVSIETRLAIGAHDLKNIGGNVHLKITDGTEIFWPLGLGKQQSVGANEYAYVDDANEIICRLEVRQVEKTKITLDTTDAFFIVQGNPATDGNHVWRAAEKLIELTKRFCGGDERILYRAHNDLESYRS
jgi:DNA/RNA-binding domain of Phe-tRNA-synthetase-like protein